MTLGKWSAAMLGLLCASSAMAKDDDPTLTVTGNVTVTTQPSYKISARSFKLPAGTLGPARSFVYLTANSAMEKGTFLGVTTSPATAALREQMNLPKGLGLVVETVENNSPAEKAGLKQYDLIQKLNDQLLVNQQQLQVLIRMQKSGDAVKLEVLRHGQPQTLSATLIEKDVPAIGDATEDSPGTKVMTWTGQADPAVVFDESFGKGKVSRSNWVWKNGDQTLEISDTDGKRKLTVTDKNDQTRFDGPIDTPAQREQLSADVKDALATMEKKFNILHDPSDAENPTTAPATSK